MHFECLEAQEKDSVSFPVAVLPITTPDMLESQTLGVQGRAWTLVPSLRGLTAHHRTEFVKGDGLELETVKGFSWVGLHVFKLTVQKSLSATVSGQHTNSFRN